MLLSEPANKWIDTCKKFIPFSTFMIQFAFQGHSGCSIDVLQEQNGTYVRKCTHDPKYVTRLKRQFEKQRRAYTFYNLSFLQIPLILTEYNKDDTYGCDMEYFRCEDPIGFFERGSREDIDLLIQYFIEFIEYNLKNSIEIYVSKDIFSGKYLEVKEKILANSVLSDSFGEQFFTRIDGFFDTISPFLPVGYCHGDFKLANMLIMKDGKKLVLIDWLDTFLETPLNDIVTLRQDTKYYWSLQLYTNSFDRARITMILDYIDDKIDKHFQSYTFYQSYYSLFQLLNFLRILPYVKDKSISLYLKSTVYNILSEINL